MTRRGVTLEGLAAFEGLKLRGRRAERCIGLAIRKGQAEGRIAKRGDVGGRVAAGRQGATSGSARNADLVKPCDVTSDDDRRAAYALTDNVPEAAFEAAIKEAKAEPAVGADDAEQ